MGSILKPRKAYMPVGHLGPKRMGEVAEIAFMYRSAIEGIGVARPYGDSHPYDFLMQHGRRLSRVQVKSCFTPRRTHGRTGFHILVAYRCGKELRLYTQAEVDFIAVFVARYNIWYVIPVEALGRSKTIRVYPHGKGNQTGAFYESYREAWHLLKE